MEKSIHSEAHRRLTNLLRELRASAGLTQAQVAARLNEPQSFVAKYEAGERRLDLVELAQVADALGTDVRSIVEAWDTRPASG